MYSIKTKERRSKKADGLDNLKNGSVMCDGSVEFVLHLFVFIV